MSLTNFLKRSTKLDRTKLWTLPTNHYLYLFIFMHHQYLYSDHQDGNICLDFRIFSSISSQFVFAWFTDSFFRSKILAYHTFTCCLGSFLTFQSKCKWGRIHSSSWKIALSPHTFGLSKARCSLQRAVASRYFLHWGEAKY